MRRCLIRIFVIVAALSCASASAESLTPEKRADIERLLVITDSLALGKQMGELLVPQFTDAIKKLRPDIPEELMNKIPSVVLSTLDENMHTLRIVYVLLYHKHFTAADIKGLLKFYSSDIGRKTIKVTPLLLKDSVLAGQQWGQALGPKIDLKIKATLKQNGIEI